MKLPVKSSADLNRLPQQPSQMKGANTGLICRNCGTSLPPGSAFCGECGNAVSPDNQKIAYIDRANSGKIFCAQCKSLNEPVNIFCGNCGAPLVVKTKKVNTQKENKTKVKTSGAWWLLVFLPVLGAIIAQVSLKKQDSRKAYSITIVNILLIMWILYLNFNSIASCIRQ